MTDKRKIIDADYEIVQDARPKPPTWGEQHRSEFAASNLLGKIVYVVICVVGGAVVLTVASVIGRIW